MGFLHHANYLNYFEMGRVELFRVAGGDYGALEERGFFLVIVSMEVQYRQPARYDDVLSLTTTLARQTPAKIIHEYELRRGEELLTTGRSTIACVNRSGQVQRIDDELLFGTSK